MDPVSLTASIVAMIQIADSTISICKGYITAVKDAPRDLRAIMIEVGSVKSILEVLESLVQGDNQDAPLILKTLHGSNGPIQGCRETLAALDSLFPTAAQYESSNGKRMKILLSLENLAWPFKEGKARKLIEDIGRYKLAISLALTTESVHDIKTIKSDVKRLCDFLDDKKRESILKWLVITDPSSNHNGAWSLREPHTGKWLTRSTEYRDWMNGSTSFLWMYGIPGSRKTILASFVVEDVKEFCKSTVLNGWAYYYFYFRREKDEVPHFLCWVINQLCRQSKYIPPEVQELHHHGGEPGTASLLIALHAVLKGFQQVYLILDALDESTNRPQLLDVLIKLSSDANFAKIRILATSRKEQDIERALRGITTVISLNQNQWVDDDIRLYIQNSLCEDRKLSCWPEALKAEIEVALVKGAMGMFRWVFCQLDILGRLESASEIRKALRELPESLDETYERILNNIHPKNRTYANRALQLLSTSFINTLEELTEAVIVDVESCALNTDDRFLNPEGLLDICTCLITYQENLKPQVRLAHYSVQEYLVSERMRATFFKTSEIKAKVLAGKIFMTYLLNLDYKLLPAAEGYLACRYDVCECYSDKSTSSTSFDSGLHILAHAKDRARKQFPLIETAINEWIDIAQIFDAHLKDQASSEEYADFFGLIFKLLNPARPNFRDWIKQFEYFRDENRLYWIEGEVPIWNMPLGTEHTVFMAYICYFNLIRAAEIFGGQNSNTLILENQLELLNTNFDHHSSDINKFFYGTLLHITASLNRIEVAEVLIANGADINTLTYGGLTVLNSALLGPRGTSISMVELLLASNANPNSPNAALTPLQSAVLFGLADDENVLQLLEAEADVNAVGNDEAVIAMIRYENRNQRDEAAVRKRLLDRTKEYYYDTPLRIVESRLEMNCRGYHVEELEEENDELEDIKESLLKVEDILISHGALSLHKPPKSLDVAKAL